MFALQKKTFFFLGLAVFWLVIIGGFIVFKEFTLWTGKVVVLKTAPVDPRDLFRGDYVVLRYDINTIDLDNVAVDKPDFKQGDRIFVALDTKNAYAQATRVSHKPITDQLFIRGTVQSAGKKHLMVKYGIESYFVPEKKGHEIERPREKESLSVKIAVDRFGRAVIKSLMMNGKPITFS